MTPSSQPAILMIGADAALAYLIGRYAEQGGYKLVPAPLVPSIPDMLALQPAAILFLSVDDLGAAQRLIAHLADGEFPILACVSLADEARAREMGADHCLVHPLTYAGFMAALALAQARAAEI